MLTIIDKALKVLIHVGDVMVVVVDVVGDYDSDSELALAVTEQ